MVQVDADTYALAYSGGGDDGFISTFTISADGSTTLAEVESIEHDAARGQSNSLVHVVGDTYALAYEGDDNDGFISTFDIDSGGDITPIKVANHVELGEGSSVNLEHDTEYNKFNSLVHVVGDTCALAYSDTTNGDISTFTIDITPVAEETKKSGSDCYDCEPPKLQQAQIQIASAQKIIATDDDPIHITANVGDKVMVILNVTDNKSVDTFRFAGLYTNYQEKPSDMNAFYANNYDKWKHVSTSFYEWNVRADDVAYDYDGTVSWSDNAPTVVTDVITDENYFMKNDDNTLEYFMMPFTFTMNDSMETSQITAKIYDASGNRLYETLPVTLEIISKEIVVLSDAEEIATLDKGDVIVIPSEDTTPLLNEPVLFTVLSQWSGYSQVTSDDAEMLSVIGLQGDSLPAWTKNLGEWVIQEKLDVSELITAINYVHNNQ
ncbi:MAG: hypothetical protein CXT79_06820 [Thaumarchaeota archaeon]|nr:MAG: hypothetical protein CXT79_06820 [Nitrososphaerota archaeon]